MKVLYVTGSRRSGTTILDNVLCEQPGFFGAGELGRAWEVMHWPQPCGCGLPLAECGVWSTVLDGVRRECAITDLGNVLALKQRIVRFRHAPGLLTPAFGRRSKRYLDRYAEILGVTYRQLGRVTGCNVIVDSSKSLGICLALERIPDIECVVVHMVRDPTSVAASESDRPVWQRVGPSGCPPHRSPVASAAVWLATNLTAELLAHRKSPLTWVRIRYEDWVRDPIVETRRIVEATREEFDNSAFLDDHTVALRDNHLLGDNPGRCPPGAVPIGPGGGRHRPLSGRQRATVNLFTLPLRPMYGYSWRGARLPRPVDPSDLGRGPFARFPPGRLHVYVPIDNRHSALAGLSLVAACNPGAVLIHIMVWAAVACFGPRILPGRRVTWSPPMPPESWASLISALRSAVGPFDGVGVYQRPQTSRVGVAMLLLAAGRPVALVKAGPQREPIEREFAVLEALRSRRTNTFRVPQPLASGEMAGWWWLAMSPLPARPHRPVRRPPIGAVTAEIQEALAGSVERKGVPEHWRPIHGDLTPWNLRRVGGRIWLLDWEDASWGPPGADEAYYAATMAVMDGSTPARTDGEVVQFWEDRVGSRPPDTERHFNADLARVLAAMRV